MRINRAVKGGVKVGIADFLVDTLSDPRMLAEINRLNQSVVRRGVTGPQAHSTAQMQGTPQSQVVARYPVWDVQGNAMAVRRIYSVNGA